ncbi:hypothetical protein [Nonomuraea dietziae]|uniref:hypothetical protein n=1 Tax=Nonomuraea dietziae TaxID=65515 RepID=UPI0031DF7B17
MRSTAPRPRAVDGDLPVGDLPPEAPADELHGLLGRQLVARDLDGLPDVVLGVGEGQAGEDAGCRRRR